MTMLTSIVPLAFICHKYRPFTVFFFFFDSLLLIKDRHRTIHRPFDRSWDGVLAGKTESVE